MSDRDALLSAICAQPDEDTPRLVFADYLEERDEAPRAAFIRDQVRLAGTPPWEPFAVRCRWHEPDALGGAAFRSALPRLDGQAVGWAPRPFRRGFGWALSVRAPSLWDAVAAPLFDLQPVGKVTFWGALLDDWRQIAASDRVRHLREIAFVLSPIEPLFALRDAPGAAGVTDLHFERSSGAGMPEVIEDLFRSGLGRTVRGLHFRMGYESLDALIDALNTGGPLERLSLSNMGITADALRRLFDGPAAAAVGELHFIQEPLESDGLRVLAGALPGTVRDLTLAGIGTRRTEGLEAFARSDRLGNLRRLDLSGNNLAAPRAVKVLSLSHALGSLRSINLTNCHIGDKGVRHITLAKWWHGLVEVNLRTNAVSAAGVKHLLNAPVPPDLTALVLDQAGLGADSRSALVRKFGPAVVFVAAEPHG